MKYICVYCGSNCGNNSLYTEAARTTGAEIAARGLTLVYGGGKNGMMGEVANAVLENGGKVIGVAPTFLSKREVIHPGLTELIETHTMHERKQIMADLSDGFLALPGGWGTLDELFEIMTWYQLGIHRKPIALLNVNGFYNFLLKMMDHIHNSGFLHHAGKDALMCGDDILILLEQMTGYKNNQSITGFFDVR